MQLITKIMTWSALAIGSNQVSLGGDFVDILKEHEAERYLGRSLCFARSQETEFQNRIAAGWAAFHKHKGELCNKFYRLRDRAKLFDAVVTPAVLYGSATWSLTQCLEQQLITVRRRMLRYVFRLHRKRAGDEGTLEDWVQYVKNCAHRVDELSGWLGMTGWIRDYRVRKWRFAGNLARQQDSRWSQQAVEWTPHQGVGRTRGAPRTRWEDQLVRFAGGNWMVLALDDCWAASEDIFAS